MGGYPCDLEASARHRGSQHLPSQLNPVTYPYVDGKRSMFSRYFPDFVLAEALNGWMIHQRNEKN